MSRLTPARAIAADATGQFFAVASFHGTVALWSVEQRRRIAQFETCFEFARRGQLLITSDAIYETHRHYARWALEGAFDESASDVPHV